jgi:tripartite-type tricarboxylate transporter receptor subunit TctC
MKKWLAAVALAAAASAAAQDAPLRILVGFPPGGGSDLIARLAAEHLRASLGANVVVENRPGASGMIAAEALKNAAPDGRTLMVSPIAVTVLAPFTHRNLKYDPDRDFAPVSLAANFQFALAVGPGSPAKTLHEYFTWVREGRARGAYGIPVAGGPAHFFGVMLGKAARVDMTPVPYKGGSSLVNDLIGGQVPAGVASLADVIAQHRAGRLRVLATSGAERSPIAPEVPTFKELGFADIEGSGWQAFHTTAGTPRETIGKLSAAIAAAMRKPEVRERLLALGLEPVGSTPEELARRTLQDTARWGPIVKSAGFQAED